MAKTLTKSLNKMIAGVCAGIAQYFGWEITLTRVIYALLTLLTAFSGVIFYIVLWIIMPQPKSNYEERMNNRLHSQK